MEWFYLQDRTSGSVDKEPVLQKNIHLLLFYLTFALQTFNLLFFLRCFYADMDVSSFTSTVEAVKKEAESFRPLAVKTYLFSFGTFLIKP